MTAVTWTSSRNACPSILSCSCSSRAAATGVLTRRKRLIYASTCCAADSCWWTTFHAELDWSKFEAAIKTVFPDRPIVEIPDNETLMSIVFDLDPKIQIPGKRHIHMRADGSLSAVMQGPTHRRAIYDDEGTPDGGHELQHRHG